MSETATAEQVIYAFPHGSMLWSPGTAVKGDKEEEALFLIREEAANVRRWGKNPPIEARGGAFFQDGIAVITVMFAVGLGQARQVYECWFNIYADGFEDCLDLLIRQPFFTLTFYDESWVATKRIHNHMQESFRQAKGSIKDMDLKPWGMNDFDCAREQTYEKFPSVLKLWDFLGGNK